MINTITSYSNSNNNPIDLETKIMNSGSVEIIKHIKDHYVSFWKQQILKSTKLSFYSNFKKRTQTRRVSNQYTNPVAKENIHKIPYKQSQTRN